MQENHREVGRRCTKQPRRPLPASPAGLTPWPSLETEKKGTHCGAEP